MSSTKRSGKQRRSDPAMSKEVRATAPADDVAYRLQLHEKLGQLRNAVQQRHAREQCLALWSRFIRARDGYRCLLCEEAKEVQAHHVFRKATFPVAELQTGNGISLCKRCHRKVHRGWNGRPRLGEALNARGGDDLDDIAFLYDALAEDAKERGILEDELYFLSAEVLAAFKIFQGLPVDVQLAGSRVRQAAAIWESAPVSFYQALDEYALHVLLCGELGIEPDGMETSMKRTREKLAKSKPTFHRVGIHSTRATPLTTKSSRRLDESSRHEAMADVFRSAGQ